MNAVSQLRVARILADLRKNIRDIDDKVESIDRILASKVPEVYTWNPQSVSKARAYIIPVSIR